MTSLDVASLLGPGCSQRLVASLLEPLPFFAPHLSTSNTVPNMPLPMTFLMTKSELNLLLGVAASKPEAPALMWWVGVSLLKAERGAKEEVFIMTLERC